MKIFKFIFSFLILTVLFTASVNAEDLSFSENSTFDSVEQNDNAQLVFHHKLLSFIDTEIESVISISQADTLPLSLEDITEKTTGLRQRSLYLAILQDCKFEIYNREYFNQFSTKQIIFPFHSFW